MNTIDSLIPELNSMSKYPDPLYAKGNADLLHRRKISIIGSRNPHQYALQMTHQIAAALSRIGICVVSGAAMGIDAAAHRGAGSDNTIAVLPCGIDLRYPAINRSLIGDIEQKGLLLSQFEPGFHATNWSFVVRNELVVALGEVLIVTQADEDSGSMRSVEYALEMGKPIYALAHRIGESSGTNRLLAEGKARIIHDVEAFVEQFGKAESPIERNDPFMRYCASMPTYEEAAVRFRDRLFEEELKGTIEVRNGRVIVL